MLGSHVGYNLRHRWINNHLAKIRSKLAKIRQCGVVRFNCTVQQNKSNPKHGENKYSNSSCSMNIWPNPVFMGRRVAYQAQSADPCTFTRGGGANRRQPANIRSNTGESLKKCHFGNTGLYLYPQKSLFYPHTTWKQLFPQHSHYNSLLLCPHTQRRHVTTHLSCSPPLSALSIHTHYLLINLNQLFPPFIDFSLLCYNSFCSSTVVVLHFQTTACFSVTSHTAIVIAFTGWIIVISKSFQTSMEATAALWSRSGGMPPELLGYPFCYIACSTCFCAAAVICC